MRHEPAARSFGEGIDEALGVLGRLIAFAAITGAVLFLIGISLKPALPDGLPPGRDGRSIFILLICLSLVVGHVAVVALLERMRWQVIGLAATQWDPRWIAGGAALGFLAIAIPAGLLFASAHAEVVTRPAAGLGPFVLDGVMLISARSALDELVWRGYAFGLLADRWGPRVAITFTSVLSAALVGLSPAATPLTMLALLALGLFLGTMRWRGGLAAAWVTHAALIATQVLLLRAAARGIDLQPPGWQVIMGEPGWLTGGEWGLEGGVAVAATLALITFLLLRNSRTHRRT